MGLMVLITFLIWSRSGRIQAQDTWWFVVDYHGNRSSRYSVMLD